MAKGLDELLNTIRNAIAPKPAQAQTRVTVPPPSVQKVSQPSAQMKFNPQQQPGFNPIRSLGDMAGRVRDYFDPTKSTIENPGFWSDKNPIATSLAGAQKRLQTGDIIPDVKFTNENSSLAAKIGEGAINLPGNIFDTVYGKGVTAPTSDVTRMILDPFRYGKEVKYDELNSAPTKIGYQIAAKLNPQRGEELGVKLTPQELLANVAEGAEPIITAATLGAGSTIKEAGKQGFKATIKEGAKVGGKYGTIYGFDSGLQRGRDAETVQDQAIQALIDAGVGGVAGVVAGAGLAATGYGAKEGTKAFMKALEEGKKQPGGLEAGFVKIVDKGAKTASKKKDKPIIDIPEEKIAGEGKKITPEELLKQETKRILNDGPTKDKKLVLRMGESERYSPKVRSKLEGEYVVKSNKETIAAAKRAIFENADDAELRAMNPKTAEDQAIGIELFNYYMDRGNVAKANAILNATSGTNEGQMIQILSQYDKVSPGGAVRYAKNLVDKYNKVHPDNPLGLTDDMIQGFYNKAKKIQGMPEGRARNIASNELMEEVNKLIPSTLADKGIAVWKAGLLTSLRTHERNMIGNYTHGAAEIAKDVPASIADRLMAMATGKRSMTFTTKGYLTGSKKGAGAAKDIIQTGYDPEQAISKYDYRTVNWGNNPVEQVLKKYTNIVFRTLGAEDKIPWHGAFARSMYDQAMTQAKNAGKAGNSKYIESLVKNPTLKMQKIAIQEANVAVFKNANAATKIASAMKHNMSGTELGKVVSEGLMPFTGVPSSIAGQIIAYSPAGLIKGIADAGRVVTSKQLPELQRLAAQEIGRGVIGTGLIGLGAFLMKQGLMTGNPKDLAEKRQWELENKPANSILVNGKWRSLNSVGPEYLVLLAGGKFQESLDEGNGIIPTVLQTGAQMAKDFTQQPLLQGTQQPLAVIQDPERNKPERYFGSQVASAVPNIIKDSAKALDPYIRENNTFGDYIQNSIPIVRNSNIIKRDPLGNRIENDLFGVRAFIDLFNSRTPRESAVIQELSRLNEAGYNATPSEPRKKQSIRGRDIEFTPEQHDQFERAVGERARAMLPSIIESPAYQNLDDERKAELIDKVMAGIRKQVQGSVSLDGEVRIGSVENKPAVTGPGAGLPSGTTASGTGRGKKVSVRGGSKSVKLKIPKTAKVKEGKKIRINFGKVARADFLTEPKKEKKPVIRIINNRYA